MQNDGYQLGKNIKMKENALEQLFYLMIPYMSIRLAENGFLRAKEHKDVME
jgi:hypothetical protein